MNLIKSPEKLMINIHKKLTSENWKSKMLLQVHDELVFEVKESVLNKAETMIKSLKSFKIIEGVRGQKAQKADEKNQGRPVVEGSRFRFREIRGRQRIDHRLLPEQRVPGRRDRQRYHVLRS
jgi:hypothetical protein